jgi:HEPN superfamily RiboL-PSP-like protein
MVEWEPMSSSSLALWKNERSDALNEIEAAHKSVGGTGRGRRYATEQLNHAYAMLLSSQFQGFCRDLHSECSSQFAVGLSQVELRQMLNSSLLNNRRLDRGNPNPDNIGSDFDRFALPFWDEIYSHESRCRDFRKRLEELNKWRNAIAHQDFDPSRLGTSVLRLQQVRKWRIACNQLATAFDEVMRLQIMSVNGVSPW